MSQRLPLRPPRALWWTLPGLAFQLVGLVALPFLVGLMAAMLFSASDVLETGTSMVVFTLLILFPVSLAQVIGLLLKSRRDVRWWRERNGLSVSRLAEILHDHARVVTLRGWMLMFSGVLLVVIAFAAKWPSFGILAAVALFLFYIISGWTVFVSTFLVKGFERGLERGGAGIERRCSPAVLQAGELTEEVFTFRDVPVPWGYFLLVEDPLPARLETESRYVVGATARRGEVVTSGRLRRTPRGTYTLGPARLWYQDVLGITRVSVANHATAQLKVLPRFRPVQIIAPPRTTAQTPDIISKPNRHATEDHFRFREYMAGDDTRRIHWRLSMRTGTLQVRQPENKEISTQDVVLTLDTWLPPGKALNAAHGGDEILDSLVEAWIAIARELVSRGDRVTLLAAVASTQGDGVEIVRMPCRNGQASLWQDLGARARWQGEHSLTDLLDAMGTAVHGVVVSARFTPAPPVRDDEHKTTWLLMDPADALGPPDPHWFQPVIAGDGRFSVLSVLRWIFFLPNPTGSEDNAAARRIAAAYRLRQRWSARRTLRTLARARAAKTRSELEARGDAIYTIERRANLIRLVGVRGHGGAP